MAWHPIAREYKPLMIGSIDGTDDYPHDNGIVRAMAAKYKPNKSVVGDPDLTVFVARLNPKTNDDTLWKAFRNFGEIKSCRLVRDIVTGFSRRYAFIEFEEESSVSRACRDGHGMTLDGNTLFVDNEHERTLPGWVPRRFGGGFGGEKESGQLRFGGKDRPFRTPYFTLQKDKRTKGTVYRKFHRSMDDMSDRNSDYGGRSDSRHEGETYRNRNRDRYKCKFDYRPQDFERSRDRDREYKKDGYYKSDNSRDRKYRRDSDKDRYSHKDQDYQRGRGIMGDSNKDRNSPRDNEEECMRDNYKNKYSQIDSDYQRDKDSGFVRDSNKEGDSRGDLETDSEGE